VEEKGERDELRPSKVGKGEVWGGAISTQGGSSKNPQKKNKQSNGPLPTAIYAMETPARSRHKGGKKNWGGVRGGNPKKRDKEKYSGRNVINGKCRHIGKSRYDPCPHARKKRGRKRMKCSEA